MHKLETLGWKDGLEVEKEKAARVITVQKNSYRISDGEMDYLAHLSGKFLNEASSPLDFPAVGDWVEVQKLPEENKAVIKRIVPRTSQFVRQAAGERTDPQIVAANIDIVFIVNSLNHDLNARRIERYILLAYESGATPIVLLTKKDQVTEEEVRKAIATVSEVAIGVDILTISSLTGDGLDELETYLSSGKTGALLGSSGVGKSTLINSLLGYEVQETKEIREDDSRGRHTTTHREMFMLPNGAMIIDTPGMREIQMWDGETAIEQTFQDVEVFASECKFTDCKHKTEPGCRIREAIETGELTEKRFRSFIKLQREIAYEKRKQDQKAKLEEKSKWKKISKYQKNIQKHNVK
ncbi:ribosome small subunit-dependent GTPase A [Ornithinibacillus californiensis]|uniref:ribosome small subunit-dependent GTPase A n=1 Tax=Ornithinibacillus californiensis TaxID=161536 RepID=UPI00064DB1E7|nr:ribosome small subunit-dependent GTPase A [Ornithinibacillus californiensis]